MQVHDATMSIETRAPSDSSHRPDEHRDGDRDHHDSRDGHHERSDDGHAGRTQTRQVPVAPLGDLIGRTRYVVLLAVLSVLLLSMVMFVAGSAFAIMASWHSAVALSQGNTNGTELSIEILEIVTVMLKAVVFYLIGVGLYSLFIAPLNLTTALGLSTLTDLEIKIVSVIIVILGVTYLEHFIRWQEPVEILIYGVSLAIVVASLVFFQIHTHHAARADADKESHERAEAQHELFHEDHEQREVPPTAAK